MIVPLSKSAMVAIHQYFYGARGLVDKVNGALLSSSDLRRVPKV
jgi:hypothetical protein